MTAFAAVAPTGHNEKPVDDPALAGQGAVEAALRLIAGGRARAGARRRQGRGTERHTRAIRADVNGVRRGQRHCGRADDPRAIEHSARSRTIPTATVKTAQALGRRMVAEGVEPPGQLAFLREIRCGEIQGLLVGRPMSAEAIAAWEAEREIAWLACA